jgi:hypothetical protein
MSQRGLLLALQRLHDDPGFAGLIQQDPQNTLGIYDLDDDERSTLEQAVMNSDNAAIQQMASRVGVDWEAGQIQGAGTMDDANTGGADRLGVKKPNAFTGDGYDGSTPHHFGG